MARGREEEAPETSAFASNGRKEVWPPIYEDSKDMSFADEQRWPTKKLVGRIAMYEEFLNQDYPMARARAEATRILTHMNFEYMGREGLLSYLLDEVENEQATKDTRN